MNRSRSVVKNSNSNSGHDLAVDDEFGEVVVHHENRERFGVSPTPTRRKLMLQMNRGKGGTPSATATSATATSRRSRRCVTPEPQPRLEQEATVHRRNVKKVESIPPPPPPPPRAVSPSKLEMRRPIHYPNSPVAMSKKRLSSLQVLAAAELQSPVVAAATVQPTTTRKRASSIQSPTTDASNTYRSPSAVQVRKRATSARRRSERSSNEMRQQKEAPQQQQKARDETKVKRRPRAKSVGPSAVTSYANDAISARKNNLPDHSYSSGDQDRCQTPSMVSLSSSSTSSSASSSNNNNSRSSNNDFSEGFGRRERKKEGELSERAMKILMEHHLNDLPEWLRRRIEKKMRQASPQRVRPSSPSRRQEPRLSMKTSTATNNNNGIQPLPF